MNTTDASNWIRAAWIHATESRARRWLSFGFLLLLFCFLWRYWSTIAYLANRWNREPEYSHGYFIPVVSLVWLWYRRENFAQIEVRPSSWGFVILAIAAAMCLFGEYYYYRYVETISLLVCLVGLTLLLGGWGILRCGWLAIAYLFLMIPLPGRLSGMLAHPLQRMTTLSSTYVLQTLGLPAVAQGNVITLKAAEIGIVEACSGLRMLVFFFATSVAVAMFVQRALWEKVLIVLSAIPIAILSNLIRVIVTALLHEFVGSEIADKVFHDFAGLLMSPLALALLYLELKLLDQLMVPVQEGPVPI